MSTLLESFTVLKAYPGAALHSEVSMDPTAAAPYVADGYLVKKDAGAQASADNALQGLIDATVQNTIAKMAAAQSKSRGSAPFALAAPDHAAAEARDHGSFAEWCWAMAGQAQTMERGKAEHCKNLLVNKYKCKINPEFGKEYESAVGKGAGGFDAGGSQDPVSKASVQVENVGALGGITVPPQFSDELFKLAGDQSLFLPRVKRYTMTGKEMLIPAIDYSLGGSGNSPYLGGMNATWTGENIGFTQQSASVRQIKLSANLLAGYTQASRTLLADNRVGLGQVLTDLFSKAIAFNVDYAIFLGDGIDKPKGMMVSSAASSFSRANWATSGLLLGDLAKMDSRLIPEEEGNAMWVAAPSFKQKLYPMTDASGKVAFLPNFPASPSGSAALRPTMSVFGKPIYWSQLPASSGTAKDINLVIPSLYAFGLREEIEIGVSEHYAFTSNLLTWRFLFRGDGASLLNTTMTLQNGDVVAPFIYAS